MNDSLLDDFKQHLVAAGRPPASIKTYISKVRHFLKYTGDQRLDRLSEQVTRSFFEQYKGDGRRQYVSTISLFLHFACRAMPVVMGQQGALPPPVPRKLTKKELALRNKWALEKLIHEKEKADDLIAVLARRVIDHYVYFGKRLKGEPDDLDELDRFAADCREIIERNLPLFMGLSAGGRNLHPKVDERVINS